jgi:hypothetical protein
VPPCHEALNGENIKVDKNYGPGRDSNVVKEKTVLTTAHHSTEGEVSSTLVEPSEEQEETWYDTEEDIYYDCQEETWYDTEEDIYYDCQEPLVWFDCKQSRSKPADKWHECKQIPPLKPSKPKKPVNHVMMAYPCALMLLSFMMLPMHTVGMMLKLCGMKWRERRERYYDLFYIPSRTFSQLKLYWWPPPNVIRRSTMNRKKVLLTALSIAMMKASAAAPPISLLGQDKVLLSMVKKATGSNGLLMTAKLSTEGVERVRDALEALSGS